MNPGLKFRQAVDLSSWVHLRPAENGNLHADERMPTYGKWSEVIHVKMLNAFVEV